MNTFSCPKTYLDLVLKNCTSTPGSIFNSKSMCFQRSMPAGMLYTDKLNVMEEWITGLTGHEVRARSQQAHALKCH